ncbi:hypothetical protein DFH29DRAFT_1010793 [Suillus ampliporus]|nr:hypothetical protein DFH29DRAFT_1010793 [Suillus ampliporus]
MPLELNEEQHVASASESSAAADAQNTAALAGQWGNFMPIDQWTPPRITHQFKGLEFRTASEIQLLIHMSAAWFSHQPGPDQKMVLSSKSSHIVTFWFNLPKPFQTLVNFNFNCNNATFSLFEDIYLFQSIHFLDSHDPPLAVNSNGSPWIPLFGDAWVCSMYKMRCRQQNYSCTLNADGSLKDASDITFFNDPDDEVPLPQVPSSHQPSSSTTSTKYAFSVLLKTGHTPATVTAGSQCSGQPSKPSACINDADNACGLSSSSGTRKCALLSTMNHPAPKKVAM